MTTAADIEAMIARMALGERAAFGLLYDATSAKLFGLVLRVLKDRAEAEDVLQDVYIKVWQNAGRYASNGFSPISWLATIARNSAIDRLRERGRRPGVSDDGAADLVPDRAPTPEANAIAASEARRIEGCLGQLPNDRARAVRGAYLDGLSYDDLAMRHKVPLNTMRTWLRRSLQALRECLSHE